MKITFGFLCINAFFIMQSLASTVSPTPRQTIMLSKNAVPEGATGVIVNASCYGTNNRGTTNPLSAKSTIFIHIKNSSGEGVLIDIPSAIVTPEGAAGKKCGLTELVSDSVKVNNVPQSIDTLLAKPGFDGVNIVNALKITNLLNRTSIDCPISQFSFGLNLKVDKDATYTAIQVFPTTMSSQAFYGYNGAMDRGTKFSIKQSIQTGVDGDTNQFIHITANFPGQDGFCGGFHSPLMFFFKEAYPAFTGSTTLLKGELNPTSWVEQDHQGYFLVQLKKPNAAILVNNLFGDNSEFKNGFEALDKLDSNHDKIIDQKDNNFKNLYLWKDKNGNGKNDEGEVKSLASFKILSINLNYNNEYRIERNMTIFKGRSTFKYINKGHEENGQLFDVFFESLPK